MKSSEGNDIRPFFEPESVAVIGSLREGGGLGYGVIKNLRHFGYKGRIYPVSPSGGDAFGLTACASVGELPEPADIAVVITPPPTVPGIIDECVRNGIKAALVVSENFAEAGGEGSRLQSELVEIGRRTAIRIMGPNTVGILNTSNGFTTLPHLVAYGSVRKGSVAYCSQSGFVAAPAQPLEDRAYPVSKMCDLGNKCDVNEVDILDYLAGDPETEVVSFHLEDIKDGPAFLESARNLVGQKPLLVLKPGRTKAGASASASHTRSLAGNEQVYSSAFRQVGIIRLNTWQEYWDLPRVFAGQPLPAGNRFAFLTLSGGVGVQAIDAAVESGLSIARFSDGTLDKLASLSSRLASNPVDLGPVLAVAPNPFEIQEEAIRAVMKDPGVDCATVAAYAGFDALIPVLSDMFDRLELGAAKPVTIWIYGMQLAIIEEMSRRLEAKGLPTYLDLETAVKALGVAAAYSRTRSVVS